MKALQELKEELDSALLHHSASLGAVQKARSAYEAAKYRQEEEDQATADRVLKEAGFAHLKYCVVEHAIMENGHVYLEKEEGHCVIGDEFEIDHMRAFLLVYDALNGEEKQDGSR